MDNLQVQLTMTLAEANRVFRHIGKAPLEETFDLYVKLRNQVEAAVAAAQALNTAKPVENVEKPKDDDGA